MSNTRIDRFRLSSDDCELLVAFAEGGSLSDLAARLGRDISVVSRQIKRMSERSPVLEKSGGRWKPTRIGEEMIHWSREAMRSQIGVFSEQSSLALVTTHEFGARILAPGLRDLMGGERTVPSVHCSDTSIEARLLSGQAELGFDCGRPESPLIKYKLVRNEPLALVASPAFLKRHGVRRWEDLLVLPYVEYGRISPTRSLGLKRELADRAASFNTVSAARAATAAGLGWSLLPRYAVSDELGEKTLRGFTPDTILHERFGVWWLRTSERIEKHWVPRAIAWLAKQDLGKP